MLIAALSLTGTDLPRENGPSSPSSSPHSTSSSGFSPSPPLPQGETAGGPPSSIGSSIGTPGATGGQTAAGSSHAGASTSPSHPGAGNSQPNKPSGDSAISSGTTGNTAGSSSSGQTTTTTTGPTTTSPSVTPSGKIIAGYYAGWSSYKGYTPDKIPANRLTHLHYAFAKIDPSANAVALADPSNDRKNFAALRKLKQRQPALKTLISIGGWDYSTYFSDVASSAARREAFAQSCLEFILEHGFDGIDLDWEYPVSGGLAGNTNRPQDKQNFTLLLQAIREKLNRQSAKDGRQYYLTIAGAANTSYLSKIEPAKVSALVDYLFVMSYDIHGPWDSYADLNAPLYKPQESSPQYKNSVYDGIRAYLDKGVPAKKLILGMPFYGYLYQGVSGRNNGLYSSFRSAKAISYDSLRKDYLNNSAYAKLWHDIARVPYLYGNDSFISYEDPSSIAAKATMAKSMGLAGAGAWELSQDTSGSLLKSAWQTLSR